jgi:hypothetical protein
MRIRRFLEAVLGAAISKRGEIAEGGELDCRLAWAAEQADR